MRLGRVEIEEIRPHWLNPFLPANARVQSLAPRSRLSRALAA
ncbi:hypothetical protein [Pseudomonas sp. R5(2019)]|nr:hypothetical protein [Pseudomonas sp. R5(2019)]